jgi:hypothetical protein
MKYILVAFIVVISLSIHAQTNIEKTIPIKAGQKLVIIADDPSIKLQTWDKNEVLIKGIVSINQGENDSAYGFEMNVTSAEVKITGTIKDKENIPKRIVIKKDEHEYYFKTSNMNDPEIQKFFEQNGRDYSYMSNGIIRDIKLEIFVPNNTETLIQAKYGLIEIKNYAAPLTIESKYGGVDASVVSTSTGELTARSRHGEILTNLDVKFNQSTPDKTDKWTEISAKLGNGPKYVFESKYGNIYLRKPEAGNR